MSAKSLEQMVTTDADFIGRTFVYQTIDGKTDLKPIQPWGSFWLAELDTEKREGWSSQYWLDQCWRRYVYHRGNWQGIDDLRSLSVGNVIEYGRDIQHPRQPGPDGIDEHGQRIDTDEHDRLYGVVIENSDGRFGWICTATAADAFHLSACLQESVTA